jgi:hypothetical protein
VLKQPIVMDSKSEWPNMKEGSSIDFWKAAVGQSVSYFLWECQIMSFEIFHGKWTFNYSIWLIYLPLYMVMLFLIAMYMYRLPTLRKKVATIVW